jgi:hypothetical protein
MVRVSEQGIHPSAEELRRIASRNQGDTWIIGNEPDVIWQDNTTPERYAANYNDAFQALKEIDPTAKVAVGGIAQVTPLRLAYLDRVLASYQNQFGSSLPTDMWTIHVYSLREERDSWGVDIPPGFDQDHGELYEVADHSRLDLFEEQIRSFQGWMMDNGYRELPLAITEFGILMPSDYGFPPDLVQSYMLGTFDLMLTMQDEETGYPEDQNRLVQNWAWFSLASKEYPTSDLADLELGELTTLGQAFRDCVQRVTSD